MYLASCFSPICVGDSSTQCRLMVSPRFQLFSAYKCRPHNSTCAPISSRKFHRMTLFYSSPSSYSTSTQSNPFYQGGWKSHIQRDETPQPRHLTDLHSNWEGSSVYTIPTAWPSATQPFRPASDLPSTTLLFSPLPSCNGQLINCVVSGGQTVYTVNTDNPGLTLVKDAARRPVALIEWASMPVIDIRGDKGKKRLDQWLIRDKVLP